MGFVYPFKHHLEGLKHHFLGKKKRVVGAERSLKTFLSLPGLAILFCLTWLQSRFCFYTVTLLVSKLLV